MKRQLGLCMAYFKSSNIQPLLHQKPWTFSKPSLFSVFFFHLMSFLVFHYISDGSSQFHNIILEDFLKIKPEFESTYSLAHVQPPLLFFVSVLPFLKQFLQQMQPALSTQLHYSVYIPVNIQLKRNNDFHLNLTSSAVPDMSFTIRFLYLANSNRL